MSKVCYIHPSSSEKPSHWVMPAGIFGILDLLQKEGFYVDALNYPMEKHLNPCFSLEDWLYENPAKYYLVGMHWYVHIRGASEIIRIIKKINKNAIVIVGGISASLAYQSILNNIPDIDFLITGDGEYPIPKLIKGLENNSDISSIENVVYENDGHLYKTSGRFCLTDFDKLTYSNLKMLHNVDKYLYYSYPRLMKDERSIWLVNGRGCLFNCAGCDGAKDGRMKEFYGSSGLIVRTINDVIEDIKKLQIYNLDYIKLTHDIGSMGKDYFISFLNLYKKLSIKTKLYNEFWQYPSTLFLNTANNIGLNRKLEFAITAYTGSEKLRSKLGKYFSNAILLDSIKMCLNYKFYVQLFFSSNLPDSTIKDQRATYYLIHQLQELEGASEFLRIFYEPFIADPFSNMNINLLESDIFNNYIITSENNNVFMNINKNSSPKEKILEKKILECIR